MRMFMAGALAAVALSWATAVPAADTKAEQSIRGAAERTRGDVAAPDARTDRGGQPGERSARGAEEKKHPLFEGKNNFDFKGKVAEVSPDSVTIQRDELPSAKLHVSKNTKIEVDGKKSSVDQLKRGQDVKASFNLQGDKAEAVELKADKLEKGDRKEMSEQQRENEKALQERKREAQPRQQR